MKKYTSFRESVSNTPKNPIQLSSNILKKFDNYKKHQRTVVEYFGGQTQNHILDNEDEGFDEHLRDDGRSRNSQKHSYQTDANPSDFRVFTSSKIYWDRLYYDVKIKSLFEFKKNIGSGSFSKVYLVRSLASPAAFYSLKVVSKSNFVSENRKKLLESEVEVHSCIDHPNIIKLHGFLEDRKNVCKFVD